MSKNILDDFKRVNIQLREPIMVTIAAGEYTKINTITNTHLIAFDLIGIMVDYCDNIIFIPWANIASIRPILEEDAE